MSEAVSERPTFEQAFAAEPPATESLPVTPPTDDAAPAQASADATVPPVSATDATDHASPEGPIPLERHKAILDGVYRERDEAKQQLEGWKAYEWAKQVPKEQFDSMLSWYQRAQTDRMGFLRDVVGELKADPQAAPEFRSWVARELGTRTASTEPDLKPDIPVYDGQGQLVAQTFSAEKVQSIVQHAVQQAIAEHVQPLKQDADSRRQAEQQAEQQRQAQAYVASESARIRSAVQKLPHADQHWAAIVEKAKTYSDQIPVGEALRDAYLEVVLPTLTQTAKTEVLDSLKTKAAAGSVNPSGAVVASTKRPSSFLDPGLTW